MALQEPITLMFSEVFLMGNFGVCNYLSDLSFSCTGETPQRKKNIITAQHFYAGAGNFGVCNYLSDLSFSCTGETPQRKKNIIAAQHFYAGANRLTVVDKSSQ